MTQLVIIQFTQNKSVLSDALRACLLQLEIDYVLCSATQVSPKWELASAFLLLPEPEETFSFLGFQAKYALAISVLHAAAKAGKTILGMGLGGRILVECGLVPGVENTSGVAVKAISATCGSKSCDVETHKEVWVAFNLVADAQLNRFTQALQSGFQGIAPIVTRQGRFVATPALMQEIKKQGMDLFHIIDPATLPAPLQAECENKIVSILPFGQPSVLAFCNKLGNVLASSLDFSKSSIAATIFQALKYTPTENPLQYDAKLPLYYFPRPPSFGEYFSSVQYRAYGIQVAEIDQKAVLLHRALQAWDFQTNIQAGIYLESNDALSDARYLAFPFQKNNQDQECYQSIFLILPHDTIEKEKQLKHCEKQNVRTVGEYLSVESEKEIPYHILQSLLTEWFGLDIRLHRVYRYCSYWNRRI